MVLEMGWGGGSIKLVVLLVLNCMPRFRHWRGFVSLGGIEQKTQDCHQKSMHQQVCHLTSERQAETKRKSFPVGSTATFKKTDGKTHQAHLYAENSGYHPAARITHPVII